MQAALTGPWSCCCVCGKFGPKRFVKQAVADKLVEMWRLSADEAKNLRIKESMICPWCGSKTRSRCLAETFLGLIKTDGSDQPQSVKIAATGKLPRTLILNQVDGLSEYLGANRNVVQTEFIEDARPGETRDGLRHEDAQNLTFSDASFDLVISSETLEHIPDLDSALSEIWRVLAPGGVHLFTIPLKPGTARTETRCKIDSNGEPVDLIQPRLHHPGGTWGWPVVTEFGDDLVDYLTNRNWLVEVYENTCRLDSGRSISQSVCPVFIAKRPSVSL
jgi:SAM-dependent methyltransferase